MIRQRLRSLIKFREVSPRKRAGSRTNAFRRQLAAPIKFASIMQLTAAAYGAALKIEKKDGSLPKAKLQSIMSHWAHSVLRVLALDIKIKGATPEMDRPVLFVGNHISYIDIPLLMASVPVVFVAKHEVSKWFIIGTASKKAGTVFVKRDDQNSRANASNAIADTILKGHQSVGVFPSSTTCISEKKPWRQGVFKIAAEHKIPVQPFRIRYEPLRPIAYIDDDTFATHLMAVLRLKKIKAIIEFDDVRMISDPTRDCATIQDWTRQTL